MPHFLSPHLIYILLFLLFGFSSCIVDKEEDALPPGATELKIGEYLPAFTVTTQTGDTLSTEDLRGSCSVIVFFHTQCPDCQKELPIVQRIYGQYGRSIRLVCISRSEEEPFIFQFWKKNGLTMPYSAQADDRLYRRFAFSRIPRVYVSDAGLQIRAIFTDQPVASFKELERAIEECMEKE